MVKKGPRKNSDDVHNKIEGALNDANIWVPSVKGIATKTSVSKSTTSEYLKRNKTSVDKRRRAIDAALRKIH